MTIKRVEDTEKIKIKINRQAGSILKCGININTRFKDLVQAYCLRVGVSNVRFRYDGLEIRGTDTPLTHELEDGDMIEAYDC